MSNYRVKHFEALDVYTLEAEVDKFLEQNEVDVLKYTLTAIRDYAYVGVLEYEELDHED